MNGHKCNNWLAWMQEIVGDIMGQAQVACLMCLGHNKGWEEAVSILAVCLSAWQLPRGEAQAATCPNESFVALRPSALFNQDARQQPALVSSCVS